MKKRTREYVEQDIAGETPPELLLLLYDTGLRACRRRDRRLAISVLIELMGGIDVSCGEFSHGLIRLYEYALRQVRENRFEFAETLLQELSESSGKSMNQAADGEPATAPMPD